MLKYIGIKRGKRIKTKSPSESKTIIMLHFVCLICIKEHILLYIFVSSKMIKNKTKIFQGKVFTQICHIVITSKVANYRSTRVGLWISYYYGFFSLQIFYLHFIMVKLKKTLFKFNLFYSLATTKVIGNKGVFLSSFHMTLINEWNLSTNIFLLLSKHMLYISSLVQNSTELWHIQQ